MVYGPPTPADEGSKVVPLTPGPLNVPPDTAGTNVTEPSFKHKVADKPVKLASGNGLTVIK